MRLALTAALILISGVAHAATFVPSSAKLRAKMGPPPAKSPWTHSLAYGFQSDYADSRKPRAYTHVIAGNIGYEINKRWSLGADLGIRAETVQGQIPKEEQQTYSETVNPTSELSVAYGEDLGHRSYGFGIHGEPLWTEDARREGHQGLLGADANIKVNFFNKKFSMTHALDGTSMINTFHYGSDKRANPDYFWTYKWKNEVRFART